MSEEKFTKEELEKTFPNGIPIVLMKLIFPEKSSPLTVGEIRHIARAIAYYDERNKNVLG